MTTGNTDRRSLTWLFVFGAAGVPALVLRFSGSDLDPTMQALVYGVGIVGGAFLLSWAAEAAQMDVSASLAIAVLALVAVLPEYAIEAVLAWTAGASYDPVLGEVTPRMGLVAANVTASNRLLIGLGWPVVILILWVKRRSALDLRGHMSLEMTMLIAATLMTFLIFFMNQIHIIVGAALIVMYILYVWRSSTAEPEEPELVGAAALIGSLPTGQRRAAVALLLLYSAAVILVAAEPFVESLVDTGKHLGIDEFLLIQWVAPLASESPELIVAALFGLRAKPRAGINTLISAQVNQLTLLVGSMVFVFSVSVGQPLSLPLGSRQVAEFLLTSSVSAFAIVLIAPRLISWKAGLALLALFVAHLIFVDTHQRLFFAYVYLGLAAGIVVLNWRQVRRGIRGSVE